MAIKATRVDIGLSSIKITSYISSLSSRDSAVKLTGFLRPLLPRGGAIVVILLRNIRG